MYLNKADSDAGFVLTGGQLWGTKSEEYTDVHMGWALRNESLLWSLWKRDVRRDLIWGEK